MKRMRYIHEDASKTPSKEFRLRRLNEISGIGKKAYVVLMNLYGDDTDSGEDETYVLAKKYNLRDAAAAYFKECRECTCLGESGMISLVSCIIGDKINTMNTITYYTNADWFDACDRNGGEEWNDETTDWSLVTDSQGWKLDGSDIDRMYESAGSKRPGGKPRRTSRLVESEETRYVDAEEGLELLEQGYELRGRGIYCSYRFTKVPGSDEVDFWYLNRDEDWDNGYWAVDEFLKNMTAIGNVKTLYVSREPRVSESEDPAGNPLLKSLGFFPDEDEEEGADEYIVYCINQHMDFDEFMKILVQAVRNADVDPLDVQEDLGAYHGYDDLMDAYDREELYNYCPLEREFENLLPDTVDKGAVINDLWCHAYDLMDEVAKMNRRTNAVNESRNPDRNSRRRRTLNEFVKYDSLTRNGQEHMDELVKDLQNAKARFERIIYGNNVKDEETLTELQEMHNGVCSILNELPW